MVEPKGIIPALVTPLTPDCGIDEPALRHLVSRQIDAGVHGVFATGSQGEFWAFSEDEKRQIWEIVVDEAAGRVPVFAGTAAITTRETVALTRIAASCGVDAVSVLSPYFVSPNDAELERHFRSVADATDLAVLLYSNPARTGVRLSPALVARLADHQHICGIKESSGDLSLLLELQRETPDEFALLMGRDSLILSALIHGAVGAIAATANVVPELVVAIYEHYRAGEIEPALEAQRNLLPLRLAFGWGTFPVVIKEALDLLWLEGGPCRPPVGPMSNDQRLRLRRLLGEMGLIAVGQPGLSADALTETTTSVHATSIG